MHEHIMHCGNRRADRVLHVVTNQVSLLHRQGVLHAHVNVHKEAEAHLAHQTGVEGSDIGLGEGKHLAFLPLEALEWVLDVNFMGRILASQVIGQPMAEQGSGVILNISSMAAFQPLTRVVAYGGAKAAINNFTQWLKIE